MVDLEEIWVQRFVTTYGRASRSANAEIPISAQKLIFWTETVRQPPPLAHSHKFSLAAKTTKLSDDVGGGAHRRDALVARARHARVTMVSAPHVIA